LFNSSRHFGTKRAFIVARKSGIEATLKRIGQKGKGGTMLYWALVFLLVALVAGVLGFGGIAAASAGIAKILFVVFLILFLVGLVMHLGRRGSAI
jgi:uncharacterized membrane protein YtjA (UPF0391 family)